MFLRKIKYPNRYKINNYFVPLIENIKMARILNRPRLDDMYDIKKKKKKRESGD